MKIVIIGGDAAGMSAASQARRLAPDSEITVLEMTQDVSYGACGLPYKIPEGREMDDLQIISAARFREERGLDLRLGHEVQAIDPAAHQVSGQGPEGPFELSYDKLLIATGARLIRPPIAGLDELWNDGAYALKTLQDGRELKAGLAHQPGSAVVIGGGYIGLEATEGLRERGMQVTIVEALPELLTFLPRAQRELVYREAAENGVTLHRDTRVQSLARHAATGRIVVQTSSAGELQTDLVLVATGVRPNAELAARAGLELGAAGSIAVNEQLQTSDPDIFAAGDCADAIHGLTDKSVWFPLALRANRAGKLAGFTMLGQKRAAPPVMGTAVFKFLDLQIARTGLSAAEAETAGLETVEASILASTRAHYYPGGSKLSVWLLAERDTRRLLGATMVGLEGAAHKIDTVVAALHGGFTAEQVYDMDLAYAPPFGPSWSPLLTASSVLMKKLK